jgi:hypothetical protein
MDARWIEAVEPVVRRMLVLARTDRELSEELRKLAQSCLDWLSEAQNGTATIPLTPACIWETGITYGPAEEAESGFGGWAASPDGPTTLATEPVPRLDAPPRTSPIGDSPGESRQPHGAASAECDPAGSEMIIEARMQAGPAGPSARELAKLLWPELQEGTRGPATPSVAERPPRPALPAAADLEGLERRLRLKADAARWAAERISECEGGRRSRIELEQVDRAFQERARKLCDCRLWMLGPQAPAGERTTYEVAGGCYEAGAIAVHLASGLTTDGNSAAFLTELLELVAESQSALRASVDRFGLSDPDQLRMYTWLRDTTSLHRVYIPRYMRSDDPADPAQWPALVQRLADLDSRLKRTRDEQKNRRKLLNKLKFVSRQLIERTTRAGSEEWGALASVVEELVSGGVPPSQVELREALLPLVDLLPETLEPSREFSLVLKEIDRFLASRTVEPETNGKEPSEEVRRASRILASRRVVIIGGERRPHAEKAIEKAFGLSRLDWIATREHESLDGFEAVIARPDVALVLLAIRWTSHSFGEVKAFCDRHGKPLVRLPAGYNPNQIAAQILDQCSERLLNVA